MKLSNSRLRFLKEGNKKENSIMNHLSELLLYQNSGNWSCLLVKPYDSLSITDYTMHHVDVNPPFI